MATYNLFNDGERVIGTTGKDLFVSYANNTIVEAQDGNDLLKGSAGTTGSLLRGQNGNDILEIGGTGGGTLRGGTGNDTYNILLNNSGVTNLIIDELNDGGSGTDTIFSTINFSLNNPGASGVTILGNVENLTLAVLPLGTGAIFAEGNALNNTIVGNRENNTLNGLAGNDRIFGSFGNDTIDGGDGSDFLEGNEDNDIISGGAGNDNIFGDKAGVAYAGNDTLNGGAGLDTLTGGLGADTFEFGGVGLSATGFTSTSIRQDTVTDFNSGEGDRLQINTASFNVAALVAAAGSNLSTVANGFFAGNFGVNDDLTVGGARLLQSNAYIVYNLDNGNLFYNPDLTTSGSGGGGLFATLTGIPSLTAADIAIV